MILAEPKPQLDILNPVEHRVVNSVLSQGNPAQHHGSMHEGADTTLQFLHQPVMPHERHEGAELTPGTVNQRSRDSLVGLLEKEDSAIGVAFDDLRGSIG